VSDSWAPPARPSKRGGKTRNAILGAATARFASDGYDHATLRAIAADAGVDPSMIIRHFGSKAELFAAAVQIGFTSIDLAGIPGDRIGREFIRRTLLPWERGETRAQEILLRTAPTHPEAAAGVQAILERQILPAVRGVLGGDPHARIRAGLVQSQGLGVIMMRYLLRIEPVASMDFGLLTDTIGDSIQRHLTRPLPAQASHCPRYPMR
jgi:AcrR family transcriptional regulator